MLKEIHLKIWAVSMLSVFLVLMTVLIAVYELNHHKMMEIADYTLSYLAEHQGSFPKDMDKEESPDEVEKQRAAILAYLKEAPELPFESRFFVVEIGSDGICLSAQVGRIAAVNEVEAIQLAAEAIKSDHNSGTIRRFRYVIRSEEGFKRVIFLDISRSLWTLNNFRRQSFFVASFSLLAILILSYLFSRWAMRPIAAVEVQQKAFVSNAGHELKTPLSVIEADIYLLEAELGNNEWLDDLKLQTSRLRRLTQQLIFLSRSEEVRLEAERQPIDFIPLINDLLKHFKALSELEGKRLEFHSELESATILGETGLLEELCIILIDNAFKYGAPERPIEVRVLEAPRHHLILEVENHLPEAVQIEVEKLFRRFQRGNAARTTDGSFGLGLAIAEAIVQRHDGNIEASQPSADCFRIRVKLPRIEA
ncbi:MAG: HAMP domain-containing sensor histidine kinase [Eubacteriales bacterium]|nr:HAMP domain-containing sensor histidine kinase [Eubacteriales bacterium]